MSIAMNDKVKELTKELVGLRVSRSGPVKTGFESRFVLMWIYDECQLRWPETTKRQVLDAYNEVIDET
jgi:hypothetical protein